MSEVMRFNMFPSGQPNPERNGLYVRHADYAALEAECEALREALEDALAFTLEHDSGRAGVVRGRIVAALSAQQSAHVSVPRELLERTICRLTHGHEHDKAVRELRALLNGGEA